MKVILLRDVAKIGRRFEVKEVPTGHALNFLIPRKMAEPATPEALRKLSVETKKKDIMSDRHDTHFRDLLAALKDTPLVLVLDANAQGHLFKGVHEEDIMHAISALGYTVSKREVVLKEPIKAVGDHVITLSSGTLSGTATVRITKKV